ncbi:MAG TPA: hypothetical protein VKU36_00120 [Candidatus Babeliales bacterium]|nr:hypothetical protein [Candidatus Babeliales bacterium]
MMKFYTQWQKNFLKSIQLQLFISFISLPFLIGWGLPISILSPISTLVFGPFLTAFLLISSLIFFLELLYVPNTFFIWLLEKVTAWWLICLHLEQRTWLMGFIKPSIIILCLIPIIALTIMHSKIIKTSHLRTIILGLLLIVVCAVLKIFPSYTAQTITHIPCNRGHITVVNHNNTIMVIDPAYLAARPSYESFISYTLIPEIIQATGSLRIDHLIISKFNKRILDALLFLSTKIKIQNLYIPAWKGKIPLWAWRSYTKLKKTVLENQAKIYSLSYSKKIYLDSASLFFIEPVVAKNICYYDATYQPLCIHGTINNQKISL